MRRARLLTYFRLFHCKPHTNPRQNRCPLTTDNCYNIGVPDFRLLTFRLLTLTAMNRLIEETSLYLRQHAHNPVDWHPWGEAAFALARQENKPILLSVGYSACHWCHVMAHESFENEAIAALMNRYFVNIKVDREERPDVDHIYMNAVQLMAGNGGWPMTVFLTPAGVPFYAGTYFPPEDKYGRPGFPRILEGVAQAWDERGEDINETGASVVKELDKLSRAQESFAPLSAEVTNAAFELLSKQYDTREGGFGRAPKFPPAMSLEFLLRYWHDTNDDAALEMVEHTCQKMACGGMYDQLGGGFHRYSTDAVWLVPHFEKMLYDNALLARLYLHVFQATGDEFYRHITAETLDYILREMTDANGGFYAAQDADSEGHEGKFFVWTPQEIVAVLGTEDAALVCAYYDVTASGNFEGVNILHVAHPAPVVAKAQGVTLERLNAALERAWRELPAAREERVKPARDEKIIVSWNGLMLAAFAEAAAILERPDYLRAAERNAEFVRNTMHDDKGLLRHTYQDGQARFNAYQEDYAAYADGLLALYETTGATVWLKTAQTLTDIMIDEFWDEAEGGFFFTGRSHETLITRPKELYDNATPSGNSVAAEVLQKLAILLQRDDYRRYAVTLLRLTRDNLARMPNGFGRMLGAFSFYLSTPHEIALIGTPDAPATRALQREIWRVYRPYKVVAQSAPDDAPALALVPLLQNRPPLDNTATAYVCRNYTCQQPVNTPDALTQQLS